MASFYRYSRCVSDTVTRSLRTTLLRQPVPRQRPPLRPYSTGEAPPQPHADLATPDAAKRPSLINITDVPAPHTGHIRVLTLNSPHNKNAISQQLLKELGNEILRRSDEVEFETWCFEGKRPGAAMGKGTRAVVIGSEVEGVFCAGADLKERKGMSEQETNSFLQLLRETLGTLSRLEIPTISAVSSIALGGGLELALATEFRIFTPSTLVGLPETRLGIIPGAGGAPRLKHLLGQTRATDIILTGRRIRGDEAFRIGLCDRLCGPTLEDVQNNKIGDDVLRKSAMDGALEMAKQICEGGPATTVPLMQLMRSKRSVYTAESEAYERVLKTQDRDEALRAFAEKRKPVFQGR